MGCSNVAVVRVVASDVCMQRLIDETDTALDVPKYHTASYAERNGFCLILSHI